MDDKYIDIKTSCEDSPFIKYSPTNIFPFLLNFVSIKILNLSFFLYFNLINLLFFSLSQKPHIFYNKINIELHFFIRKSMQMF